MKIRIFVLLMFVASAFFLIGCTSKNNSPIEDSKLLTNLVYNTCVSENEEYQMVEVNRKSRFSNAFHFESLKVIQSFGFKVNFDFVMTPYLDDYEIGDEVDVIFADLEFLLSTESKNTIYAKMIIFSYKETVVGFISPSIGTGNIENIPDEYSSAIFLTENEIVKYYERGDILYSFTLSQDENKQYQLTGIKEIAHGTEQPISFDATILEDSYIELNGDQVIDLVNLTKIERIEVVATITGLSEDSRKIFVQCDSKPTLQSVSYSMAILDKNGIIYDHSVLKLGDEIIIDYFQRYQTYEPVNIHVENIMIK